MAIQPNVKAAIEELRAKFQSTVIFKDDGDGGAIVLIENVPLDASVFVQPSTWVGFHITHMYPKARVYPHHVRPDLARKDGSALSGSGLHPGNSFDDRPSLMLSRQSKPDRRETDTAVAHLQRVIDWLHRCPEPKNST